MAKQDKAERSAKALLVVDQKGVEVDAQKAPVVSAAEVSAAGQMGDTLQRVLALNILAGKVHPDLLEKKTRDAAFTRSQRTDKGRFIRLLELDRAALLKAWNDAQSRRKVKRAVSLSGLVAAAKEAGLIPKGEAPATSRAAGDASAADLAERIVAILATPRMSPAAKLAKIAELPEVAAVGA